MPVTSIHSFLVHPGKGSGKKSPLSGTAVTNKNVNLYRMLSETYARAPAECVTEICFRPDENGKQKNVCLDLVWAYVQKPSTPAARTLATRLQEHTTERSKLGLLFLVAGDEGSGRHRIVLSRFPADVGILAEAQGNELDVAYIEKVFMKSLRAYKSAMYEGKTMSAFWQGRAIDKQLNSGSARELSDYWIKDFLLSELRTTSKAGSRRLGEAIRRATQTSSSPEVRTELISAASLAKSMGSQVTSPKDFAARYTLSKAATQELRSALKTPQLYEESFQFDPQVFQEYAAYRMETLNNDATLLAPSDRFDEVFSKRNLPGGETRYTTQGKITAQRLTKGHL